MNIIPHIISIFLGPRAKPPRNEFMRDNWTNNLFRLYDAIFWKKAHPNGDVMIRPEISAIKYYKDGKWIQQTSFHTFEAFAIHSEAVLRKAIRNIFSKRNFGFHFVPVMQFATPMGGLPTIFSYAIALDTHLETDGPGASSADITVALTLGGSATLLLGPAEAETLSSNIASAAWNGSALSSIVQSGGTLEGAEIWGIVSPTTGAHNLVFTRSGITNALYCFGLSYSGTSISAVPSTSSSNFLTGSGAGTITTSLTTPVDNCWVAGVVGNDFANGMTIASGDTQRDTNNGGSSRKSFDSNGVITPAGNRTCSGTVSGTGNWAIAICAIQPPSTSNFALHQFFGW